MQRLLEGQLVLEDARTGESGGAARVSAVFHTSADAVWALLLSCERTADYVEGMRACEVVEGGVEHAVVKQAVKKSWIVPRLEYTLEFRRQPYHRIDFRKIDGDLDRVEGYWTFEGLDENGALLVTHEIRVKPDFPVPRWLMRRTVKRDIPDMLACLRSLASGSGSPLQWEIDNKRCPEPGWRAQSSR